MFIFSNRVVIHFIMQRKPTNFANKNSPDVRRFAFRHFVYLATIAVDFVDSLNFSCPLLHLRKVA